MPMFLHKKKKIAFFVVFQSHTAVTDLNIIGTKCNSLTQQFIGISTTIDTWATCFDSTESSSGPQRLQIQFLQGSQVHFGVTNNYIVVQEVQ